MSKARCEECKAVIDGIAYPDDDHCNLFCSSRCREIFRDRAFGDDVLFGQSAMSSKEVAERLTSLETHYETSSGEIINLAERGDLSNEPEMVEWLVLLNRGDLIRVPCDFIPLSPSRLSRLRDSLAWVFAYFLDDVLYIALLLSALLVFMLFIR